MSDIRINMHIDVRMSTRKRLRGRKNNLKANFSNQRDGTAGQNQHNHVQHQNGAPAGHALLPASTNNKLINSLPGCSTASAPLCSQKPSTSARSEGIPPLTSSVLHKSSITVKNNGSSTTAFCSGGHKQTKMAAGLKYVALDCEMVGTGPKGRVSQLARCSMVNYDGDVIYDTFILPSMPVTDYRTRWSGIRRCDLINATPYSTARKEILKLLMGKVVIGHAIHNDFKVLGYAHPTAMTRDTSRIPLLNQKAGFGVGECASLKRLTKAVLNRDIQAGRMGHSSVEDARATMELYKVVEVEWERELAFKSRDSVVQA